METKELNDKKDAIKGSIADRFNIIECEGHLTRKQLEKVLEQFPVDFYLVSKGTDSRISHEKHKLERMEVYHGASVIRLYPPKGKKLSNAHVTNPNFQFRPDNIMDDQLGLRCCYHPKLTNFGITSVDNNLGDIEIDIYKFAKE